jgi:hypothetical protein
MKKHWVLSIAMRDNKEAFREKAPELLSLPEFLSSLERENVESFSFLDAADSRMRRAAGLVPTMPKCVEDICYGFGIVQGCTIPSGRPKITILASAKGAAVNPRTWNIPL